MCGRYNVRASIARPRKICIKIQGLSMAETVGRAACSRRNNRVYCINAICKITARRGYSRITIRKNRPQGSGEKLGIAMRDSFFYARSSWIQSVTCAPHYARYRESWVPLFLLSACGMRHSVGFAALMPSQLCHHNKKPTTRVGFLLWWGKLDSDQRSQWQQIYSLPPLAAREFPHINAGAGERSRTINLLITNQLLCHWATPACWTLPLLAETFLNVNTFFEKNQSFLEIFFWD